MSDLIQVLDSQITKGQRTRLRIIDECLRCFAMKGFEGSSVAEVCRKLKINRGLISHYFGSRENLIREVTAVMGLTGRTVTENQLKILGHIEDPIERYIHATMYWLKNYPDHARFYVLMMQRASYDDNTQREVLKVLEGAWDRIEKILRAESAAGRYQVADPREAAKEIHSLVIGTLFTSVALRHQNLGESQMRCIEGALRIAGKRPH